ncbi:ferrochelatase [Orbaceae bacterium ESL0727]|nr:ferrochelatase [Orbaceae bacterium ESL0727]
MEQGLLLVNLGTPSALTKTAIKDYLAEFLHDRHVVDLNPLIWYPILHGIILPKRVPYIMQHYQKIWINAQSPLAYYSQSLCQKLQTNQPTKTPIQCELAMTYGQPAILSALNKLQQCKKITVLPLFPQYSTTTTQAVFDKIKLIVDKQKIGAEINYHYDYADHPSYIDALYIQIEQAFAAQGKPDALVLSYHGIPIKYITKRHDAYPQRCELTTQRLAQKLQHNHPDIPVKMAYQSKFGKGEWTTPNTSHLLTQMAKEGIKHVHVICPGFSADCIETLYEIDDENREIFLAAGGERFSYIPALNDTDLQVKLVWDLLKDVLQ